jgi:DNA-binding CsgD family transcriptional regulator/PAS domain-containing protein
MVGAMNQDALLALVGRIYDAGSDPAHWPAVLAEIADAFGAGDASLSAVSTSAVPWLVAPRTDPSFLISYGAHYHPKNLFWQRMTQVPVGTAVTDRMVLARDVLRSSEFYNDWSRPQGYLSVMGATLLAEDDWRVEFVLPGKNEFGPAHLKLHEAIAPHLKRAVQLNRRLQTSAIERSWSQAALDNLAQGVLVVDSKARILLSNRAADRALADSFKLSDGTLCSHRPAETAALHAAIAAGGNVSGASDTIGISRGPLRSPLSLLVIPHRGDDDRLAGQPPAAIIFITDPDQAPALDPRQLQKRFALTQAEAGLVVELVHTGNLQAAADHLGIKIATARTHLHRVLAKTGTRSQADLMRLMLTRGVGREGVLRDVSQKS